MPNDINSIRVAPGYTKLILNSWKDFLDYVYEDMLDFETYVWRGQRCDNWKLEPTISRLKRTATVPRTQEHDFQMKQLESFKLAARGRRGPSPPHLSDENDWWALGQHHGLATPLLDWSTSPFVAAFFAFSELMRPQTKYRAIFALHQPTIESWARIKKARENRKRREQSKSAGTGGLLSFAAHIDAEEEITFLRPLSDENHRLVNQGGLFTRSRTDKCIEEWVEENHPTPEDDDGGMILMKILIPNTERDKCLRTLNRMNINPLSLFPDLSGASQYCNLFSEVKNY